MTEKKIIRGRKNRRFLYLLVLLGLTALFTFLFMTVFVDPANRDYAMKIRTPKVLVILTASFAIGSASIGFQSVINNRIVTPCLLGINAIYIFVHTFIIFIFGSTSAVASSKELSFGVDLVIMGFVSIVIYHILFKKAKGNVLYILLIGTVMATLFTSLTSSVQRIMDPNEFLSLQQDLIASFNKVNAPIITFSIVLLALIALLFRKDIKLLDVITVGRDQSINLGVDHEKTVRNIIIAVTLYISIATALVGPISFLGLIIANLSRQLFKTYKHSYLMLGAALMGAIMMLGGQMAIEHLFNYRTNVTVFINISGGIYFLYLLMTNKT